MDIVEGGSWLSRLLCDSLATSQRAMADITHITGEVTKAGVPLCTRLLFQLPLSDHRDRHVATQLSAFFSLIQPHQYHAAAFRNSWKNELSCVYCCCRCVVLSSPMKAMLASVSTACWKSVTFLDCCSQVLTSTCTTYNHYDFVSIPSSPPFCSGLSGTPNMLVEDVESLVVHGFSGLAVWSSATDARFRTHIPH